MSSTPAAQRASSADLISWRMRALGLWRTAPGAASSDELRGEDRIAAVARQLLALQGQDWLGARWALGLRAPGTREADVIAAFDGGGLVRSWPMRGTLHVLAAEDIGWMQAATNHRVLPTAPKRRQYLGIDDDTLARMVDIAVELLSGGRSASRDELGEAWVLAGIGDGAKSLGPWRYHVIWWLCQNGIAVPGPVAGGSGGSGGAVPEPRLVLAEEWIRSPRRLEGDEALAELAIRFARGRGPVQDRDLAWWSGLTVREARLGIAVAADSGGLSPVEVDGLRYWAEPELLDEPPLAEGSAPVEPGSPGDPLLLPGFDEHLLGYTDRTAVLDPQHFDRIVPGRNGMFRSTVVQRGRVVGTWTRASRRARTLIEVEPLPGERVDETALRAPAAAWGAFRGAEVEIAAVVG